VKLTHTSSVRKPNFLGIFCGLSSVALTSYISCFTAPPLQAVSSMRPKIRDTFAPSITWPCALRWILPVSKARQNQRSSYFQKPDVPNSKAKKQLVAIMVLVSSTSINFKPYPATRNLIPSTELPRNS